MPTLKERIETLEAALRDQRDPLTQAAKADHTPSKRILELESQHADLTKAVALVPEAIRGELLANLGPGSTIETRLAALEQRLEGFIKGDATHAQ